MNVYIPGTGFATQGPAPDGFHIPLSTEWQGLKTIMDGLSLTTGDSWRINLHMPFGGFRSFDASINSQGSIGNYWSSSPYVPGYPYYARRLVMNSSIVLADKDTGRSFGLSVRCFKDLFEKPTSSWTAINGTLGSAGIFRDTVNGLISITSDGTTGYTIQDKNLGATTVYSDGDTLSEANCGKYYQRGNNYGFAWTGSVTTSSTRVDASNYGPGNYYNSSTYITGNYDWSSVYNDNLRGGEDGNVQVVNELKNAYIGEYTGYTPGNNTIAYYPLTGDFKDYSGNGHDGTKSGNISFTTSGNLTYGDAIGGYTAGYVSFTLPSMTSSSYTLNIWCNITAYSQGYRWYSIVGIGNICISMCGTDVGGGYHRAASVVVGTIDGISNYTMPEQTWMNIVGVFTTTGMKCYANGQQVYTDSYSYSFSGSGGKLFSRDALTTGDYYGALSEVIIEDKAWTAEEISKYYNQTKANYGL